LVGRWCPGCIAPRSCVLAVDLPSVKVILPRTLRWWFLRRSRWSLVFRLRIYKIQLFSLLSFASP
jgi:hypothetical protein